MRLNRLKSREYRIEIREYREEIRDNREEKIGDESSLLYTLYSILSYSAYLANGLTSCPQNSPASALK
ncbi:MAG: hypothetical protein RL408_702 [Bacteroidota bacterium]|jgi:hypothetical protein